MDSWPAALIAVRAYGRTRRDMHAARYSRTIPLPRNRVTERSRSLATAPRSEFFWPVGPLASWLVGRHEAHASRTARSRKHPHHARGRRRVRTAGDAVFDRQGQLGDAASRAEGVSSGAA